MQNKMVVESAALYKIFINHASTPRHQRIRGEKKHSWPKVEKIVQMLYTTFLKKKKFKKLDWKQVDQGFSSFFFVVECGSLILAKKGP